MAENKAADTVPNLGFKDKEKALETIKALEGRDPDYQKLAVKGLIGRANRVLSITKAEEKLNNIKEALNVFDEWLKNFEKLNLSKGNMSYLPLATIKALLPLKNLYKIQCNLKFINDYELKAEGDYKKLRTVESDTEGVTWDIIRNKNLKKILKELDSNDNVAYWNDDGLPSKEHLQLILWAYSPESVKIKKTLDAMKEKINKLVPDTEKEGENKEEEIQNNVNDKKEKSLKRKSDGGDGKASEKKKRVSTSSSNDSRDSD